jgi:hypothetical protein
MSTDTCPAIISIQTTGTMEARDKVRLKQMELNMEQDPQRRTVMQRELQRLQIRAKMDELKKQLENLG